MPIQRLLPNLSSIGSTTTETQSPTLQAEPKDNQQDQIPELISQKRSLHQLSLFNQGLTLPTGNLPPPSEHSGCPVGNPPDYL